MLLSLEEYAFIFKNENVTPNIFIKYKSDHYSLKLEYLHDFQSSTNFVVSLLELDTTLQNLIVPNLRAEGKKLTINVYWTNEAQDLFTTKTLSVVFNKEEPKPSIVYKEINPQEFKLESFKNHSKSKILEKNRNVPIIRV